MDSIDRLILRYLDQNCRMSYSEMAERVGISANAVRKRVDNLIESKIIVRFNLMATPAMVDVSLFFAMIKMDGKEDSDEVMDKIGKMKEVAHLSRIALGADVAYAAVGMFQGTKNLLELTHSLRSLEHVNDVSFHQVVTEPGKKIQLNSIQKRMLRVLRKDPRALITEIATEAGLSARRVRRELDILLESEAFYFSVRWNLASEQLAQILVIVETHPSTNLNEFLDWVYENYQEEGWAFLPSATEPKIVLQLVFKSLPEADRKLAILRNSPDVISIEEYVVYSTKKYPWLSEFLLDTILE